MKNYFEIEGGVKKLVLERCADKSIARTIKAYKSYGLRKEYSTSQPFNCDDKENLASY